MGCEKEDYEGKELTGWGAEGSRSERQFQDKMTAIESMVRGSRADQRLGWLCVLLLASLSSNLLTTSLPPPGGSGR